MQLFLPFLKKKNCLEHIHVRSIACSDVVQFFWYDHCVGSDFRVPELNWTSTASQRDLSTKRRPVDGLIGLEWSASKENRSIAPQPPSRPFADVSASSYCQRQWMTGWGRTAPLPRQRSTPTFRSPVQNNCFVSTRTKELNSGWKMTRTSLLTHEIENDINVT